MDIRKKMRMDLFLSDMESIIDHRYESVVEERWRLGQRIALEELLWRKDGGMDKKTKKEISLILTSTYSEEYSFRMLKMYLEFYLSHLNLFDSDLEEKVLSWDVYKSLLSISDKKKRIALEKKMLLNQEIK